MLSTATIKAGQAQGKANYYENLAREDYYTAGGEPPGKWIGTHAENLGLAGSQVAKGELAAALQGFHPRTGEALASNAGEKHHGGYDLTFSAPKSVSIAWSAGDDATRKAISEAQQRAVESAIRYMEQSGAFRTLHGHAGEEKRAYTGGLAVATFEHSTSRNGDPQIHTHALAANLTPDGRRIDLDTRAKMQTGAFYRAELAAELQKLGFVVERDKSSFRLADIPKDLEKEFSSRRHEILAELKAHGTAGGKASAAATLATRQDKGEVDREKLVAQSQLTAGKYGVTPEKINELRQSFSSNELREMPAHADIASSLTQQASTLTPQQLEAQVFQAAQGVTDGAGARAYLEELKQSGELIELQDSEGNTRYTSREMFEIEKHIAERAGAMSRELTHSVRAETVQAVLSDFSAQAQAAGRGNGLSAEQTAALKHVTGSERLAIIEGTAGAGKSYMLDAAREVWEREGYKLHGCALAGKAAEGLEESSKIKSATIHSTLAQLDSEKLKLDAKSIIVVDEAGMCDSRLMSRLQDHVDKAGAKLVLVGDTKQLQPIDAGGAMRAQRDAAGAYVEMNEIRRQHDDAEKAMVLNAKAGGMDKVVEYLENKGCIREFETRDDVAKAVAAATIEDLKAGKTSLALAETRAEVHSINQAARENAKAAGIVTGEDKAFQAERGAREFAQGDRIIFLQNDKELGVKNGTTGSVEKADDGKLVVKLDGKETRVTVDQNKYNKLDHGYSMTVHKSQGVTVDRAHYAPGKMAHTELAYVALSRHRETVQMHITRDQRDELAKNLSKSQAKDTSADYERVKPHQAEIERAERHIDDARKRIETLEAKIVKTTTAYNERHQPTAKEQQNGRQEDYANRAARNERNDALPRRPANAAYQASVRREAAAPAHELRHVSRGDVLSSQKRLSEMPLQAAQSDHVRNGRHERDHGVRRSGNGAAGGSGSRSSEKQLAELNKLKDQLAEARKELSAASASLSAARDKQKEAVRAEESWRQKPKVAEPVRLVEKNSNDAIRRDAELARRALETHKRGDKLNLDKLDKQIKNGTLKPIKDSQGSLYFENTKNGKLYSKALNVREKTATTSRNLNHAGLTATKYVIADKRFLGVTYGSTVLKSGGTLSTEAAGKARDMLRQATSKSTVARFVTKPLDSALGKSEGWKKAGFIESLGVRATIAYENIMAERRAVQELKDKIKDGDRIEKADKALERAKEAPAKPLASPSADDLKDLGKESERVARDLADSSKEAAKEAAREASKSTERGGMSR